MADANNTEQSSPTQPINYETVAQNFQFLPMVINSLQMVSTGGDITKLNNQVTRLQEAMKQSILYLDTLDGADLTTKQQDELYEKYQKDLQQKM
jgi:hypothetical protein